MSELATARRGAPPLIPDLPGRVAGRGPNRLRVASAIAYWLGAAAAAGGAGLGTPWLVAAGAGVVAIGLALSDISRVRAGGITVITAFACMAAVVSLANALGLVSGDGPDRYRYFVYADENHLMLAAMLNLAGTVLPVLGFWCVSREPKARALLAFLPPVRGRISDRTVLLAGTVVSALVMVIRTLVTLPVHGAVLTLVLYIPEFTIFTLARAATARSAPGALPAALAITVAEALRAIMFEYLRVAAVLPVLAFVAGMLSGARSLKPLRSRAFYPIYAIAAFVAVFFGPLGKIRTDVSGVGKISAALDYEAPDVGVVNPPRQQTVVSRLTTFNQLSQIGRVVDEDGYYGGATLDYLAFAFVPRFLWPDKPRIQRGSWFAVRIGQAIQTPNGWYNNAVNMTVQGELYLNWGVAGAVVGCLMYGAFIGVLWTRAYFWEDQRNAVGAAFAFYLVSGSLVTSGDLTVVVTLIAFYMLFVAIGWGVTLFETRVPAVAMPVGEQARGAAGSNGGADLRKHHER